MQPEIRTAGLFGTSSFLVVEMHGYITTADPVHSLLYGIAAGAAMGCLGYKIAQIATHPKGTRGNKNKGKAKAGQKDGPLSPTTGEETFLEDTASKPS